MQWVSGSSSNRAGQTHISDEGHEEKLSPGKELTHLQMSCTLSCVHFKKHACYIFLCISAKILVSCWLGASILFSVQTHRIRAVNQYGFKVNVVYFCHLFLHSFRWMIAFFSQLQSAFLQQSWVSDVCFFLLQGVLYDLDKVSWWRGGSAVTITPHWVSVEGIFDVEKSWRDNVRNWGRDNVAKRIKEGEIVPGRGGESLRGSCQIWDMRVKFVDVRDTHRIRILQISDINLMMIKCHLCNVWEQAY